MPQKKGPLKEIRSGLLSRGLSLAKAAIKAGGMALNADSGRPAWMAQVEAVIGQLGELKGGAMKVGQTLSMYGEHLLPKEVNDLLKTLQQASPPLAWPAVEAVLHAELGPDLLNELEIEPLPVASASIGQVHRARIKSSGESLALKVQYPGVDQAVDTDMKLLKFILNISDLVPRGPRFDQIFGEIQSMFLQELDYGQELSALQAFGRALKDDSRYLVPRAFPRYCTRRVLAAEYIDGYRADAPEVQALSQERRNRLGQAFLQLYLRELLSLRQMQTDPHLGNYRIALAEGEHDRLVLFDFGAVREVPTDFLNSYTLLMAGGLARDPKSVERGGRRLGLLLPEDPLPLIDDYAQLCFLLTEPFTNGIYDWGASDLPKRVAAQVSRIATSYRLRAPAREMVFLDRKLGGVFVFLSVLKCVMDARPDVETALKAWVDSSPDRA